MSFQRGVLYFSRKQNKMILKPKKSQAAVEFLVLFMISIFMLTGFMLFSRGQFETIEHAKISIDATDLGEDLSRYAVFSLRTDYLKVKNFRLPIDIGGREYESQLVQDIGQTYLVTNLTDTGWLFYYPLRKIVNGYLDKSITLEHCITSKEDTARIAPAVIGLEAGRINKGTWKDINESYFDGDFLVVENGDQFSLYVMGNCVHDFEDLVADIFYDTSAIEFLNARESVSHDIVESESSGELYGDTFFESEAIANLTINDWPGEGIQVEIVHQAPEIGPIGSDSLIELVFEATGSSAERDIELEPVAFKDGLLRTEKPPGDIFRVKIII